MSPTINRSRLPFAQSGFSLIELLTTFALVSVVFGSVLMPVSVQVDLSRGNSTERELEEILDALENFVVVHQRLPCPDFIGDDGVEDAGCTLLTEGYLPWLTLGRVGETDAWGNRFRYRVEDTFTVDISATPSTTNGLTVQRRSGQRVTAVDPSAPAVIIFSCGKNGLPDAENDLDGTLNNSTDCANGGVPNADYGTYVQDALDYGTFDDLLVWQSKYILISQMVKTGQWSSQGGSSGGGGGGGDTICHMGMITLTLPTPAANAHISVHGDAAGPCP
jgi:type II secretory pathway pseudopilin PulG